MIAQLRGKIAAIERDAVVVDVGGVGFRVMVPASTVAALGARGEEVRLLTVMVVRDDFVGLYGFDTLQERELFEILRDVKGVGPKTALSILSALSPDRLAHAVSTGDVATLATAPGVGKKMAERLALELKGRVGQLMGEGGLTISSSADGEYRGGPAGDAVSALVSLGYSSAEADRAVAAAQAAGYTEDASVIIRAALTRLSRMD